MKCNLHREATPRLALILGFVLLALINVGAAEDFELLPHWKKGESLRFEIIRSREKAQPDKVMLKTTNQDDVITVTRKPF